MGDPLGKLGAYLDPLFWTKIQVYVTPGGYPPPSYDELLPGHATKPYHPDPPPHHGPLSTYHKPNHKGAGQTATLTQRRQEIITDKNETNILLKYYI